MTAREFMSQAYWLDRHIDAKLKRISDLKDLTQRVTASFEGEAVSRSRNLTSMQDAIARVMDAAAELNREIDELLEIKNQISEVLKCVRNDGYRAVLERRYLCYETWDQIAAALGFSRMWVIERHRRGMAVVEKLIGELERNGKLRDYGIRPPRDLGTTGEGQSDGEGSGARD